MGKGWSKCVAKEWDFTIAQNVLRTSLPSTHTTALQITCCAVLLCLQVSGCQWQSSYKRAWRQPLLLSNYQRTPKESRLRNVHAKCVYRSSLDSAMFIIMPIFVQLQVLYSHVFWSAPNTVWTLIFAGLNFRGWLSNRENRESLVPRKLRSIRYSCTSECVEYRNDVIQLVGGKCKYIT